jgi:RecB family exonuclease
VPISRTAPAQWGEPSDKQARATAFLERAEVRDVLAWMRLLVDPQDAAAVVRALARPPIDLRQVDLARVIQVARRRKLDLVSGLTAATESPQVPPEARERIQRFVELHSSSVSELDSVQGDVFVARLIERLGVRGRPLLAPEQAAEQQASLEQLRELAAEFVRGKPRSTPREMARHLVAMVAEAQPETRAGGWSGAPQQTARATGSEPAQAGDTVATTASELEATLHLMREEVLSSVARIGGRLGELRLDTDLDISHGVVRYLELLKLSALLQRPPGEGIAEALSDINARLLAATTPLEREILQTSTLDDALLGEEPGAPGQSAQRPGSETGARIGQLGEPSLGPFLPRKGIGLALSASDIETYRSCPLRYKFARVLRIPTGQTLHQRFGIAVHQVLERYHSEGGQTLEQMLSLLDAGWRKGGFGEREREIELREKARVALTRYHERLGDQDSQPVWFERPFSFTLGPHHLRGRVDRVDRLRDGEEEEYELIDYKTSRPKTATQLRDDVQLSLYALAAREDWGFESSRQAYYYVLDDRKVRVPSSEKSAESVKDTVLEVGEAILAQEFEPTPSRAACSICDYRIVCPASEG